MSEARSADLRVEEPGAKYLVSAESGLVRSFQELATAPRGVARLRELVLAMAVHGRLTTHSDADGSVDVLLAEIGRRGKQPVSVSDRDEVPFVLPTHWRWVKLGELGRVVGGGTPKSDDTSMWAAAGHSWLTPADLYGLKVKAIGRGRRDISDRGLSESSAQLLPTGAVLFSSRAPIGYVAIAANPLATNQGFKSCVLHISEVGDYLYWYLKHAARSIDAAASGTTFKEISGAQFARVWVPLPPLAEQRRIVARVDELMKLCDALEQSGRLADEQHARLTSTLFDALAASESAHALAENWQRIAEHFDLLLDRTEAIDAFEQTLLQLAVRGVLVSQDPTDEPESTLLKRVRAVKDSMIAEGAIRRDKKSPPLADGEAPCTLPANWIWVRLSNLLTKLGAGSTPLGGKDVYKPIGVKFLRSQNVWNDGLRLGSVARISPAVHADMRGTVVRPNDLLFNITGASIGRCARVPADFEEANVSQHVTIIRLAVPEMQPFLHLVLISPHVQQTVRDVQVGVSREGLSIAKLGHFVVPVPPLPEQHRIVARVEELRGLCTQLRARLTDARRTQSELADALVAEIV